ncbi:hypothetical protein CLOM_g811 [Closterium sp. NIES-68]|nr:hypothetical protein CLOM_g811 [Closterium sp. NIES-68]
MAPSNGILSRAKNSQQQQAKQQKQQKQQQKQEHEHHHQRAKRPASPTTLSSRVAPKLGSPYPNTSTSSSPPGNVTPVSVSGDSRIPFTPDHGVEIENRVSTPDRNGIGVTVAAGVPDNGVGIETARVPTPNKLGVVRLGVGSTVAGGGVSTMGVVVCHSHSVQFVLRPTDGAILHASKGAVKTLGYSPDELLSTSLLRLAAPLPLNDWRAVVQRLETAQIDSAALPLTLTCPATAPAAVSASPSASASASPSASASASVAAAAAALLGAGEGALGGRGGEAGGVRAEGGRIPQQHPHFPVETLGAPKSKSGELIAVSSRPDTPGDLFTLSGGTSPINVSSLSPSTSPYALDPLAAMSESEGEGRVTIAGGGEGRGGRRQFCRQRTASGTDMRGFGSDGDVIITGMSFGPSEGVGEEGGGRGGGARGGGGRDGGGGGGGSALFSLETEGSFDALPVSPFSAAPRPLPPPSPCASAAIPPAAPTAASTGALAGSAAAGALAGTATADSGGGDNTCSVETTIATATVPDSIISSTTPTPTPTPTTTTAAVRSGSGLSPAGKFSDFYSEPFGLGGSRTGFRGFMGSGAGLLQGRSSGTSSSRTGSGHTGSSRTGSSRMGFRGFLGSGSGQLIESEQLGVDTVNLEQVELPVAGMEGAGFWSEEEGRSSFGEHSRGSGWSTREGDYSAGGGAGGADDFVSTGHGPRSVVHAPTGHGASIKAAPASPFAFPASSSTPDHTPSVPGIQGSKFPEPGRQFAAQSTGEAARQGEAVTGGGSEGRAGAFESTRKESSGGVRNGGGAGEGESRERGGREEEDSECAPARSSFSFNVPRPLVPVSYSWSGATATATASATAKAGAAGAAGGSAGAAGGGAAHGRGRRRSRSSSRGGLLDAADPAAVAAAAVAQHQAEVSAAAAAAAADGAAAAAAAAGSGAGSGSGVVAAAAGAAGAAAGAAAGTGGGVRGKSSWIRSMLRSTFGAGKAPPSPRRPAAPAAGAAAGGAASGAGTAGAAAAAAAAAGPGGVAAVAAAAAAAPGSGANSAADGGAADSTAKGRNSAGWKGGEGRWSGEGERRQRSASGGDVLRGSGFGGPGGGGRSATTGSLDLGRSDPHSLPGDAASHAAAAVAAAAAAAAAPPAAFAAAAGVPPSGSRDCSWDGSRGASSRGDSREASSSVRDDSRG